MKVFLRNLLGCILLAALPAASFAQGIPCPPVNSSLANAGNDTTICPAQCANLSAFAFSSLKATTAYTPVTTTYAPDSFNVGTDVPVVGDDSYSQVIPLPFAFCFFGNKYQSCIVSTNGTLSFNVANAGGGSGFTLNGAIPTPYLPYNNSIMSPYHDLNPVPPNGGTIKYAVYGTAPCRRFVVSWNAVKLFGSCAIVTATQQIVIYESTYVIDIYIGNKPLCTSWINGMAVLGIQNAAGTQAYSFPGRNNAQWSETNAGYRFIPSANPAITYQWTNVTNGAIVGTSPGLTVCPPDTTNYALRVKFDIGCDSLIVRDTVRVNVNNPVTASFTYDIGYGCQADTVIFNNTSVGISPTYEWSFGDGQADTVKNPVHIYPVQGIYNVRLIASTGACKDTVTDAIDLLHPLDASFTVSKDSICQGEPIQFNNTSITTTRLNTPPVWSWYFGDGGTSAQQSPAYTYNRTGVYTAMLVVKDFVPCYDTAYRTIVVDSTPYALFTISDSVLCEGAGIRFVADYLPIGNTGIRWDFGDGTTLENTNPLTHAYDTSGTYTVNFTADYRLCPDQSYTRNIEIRSFPSINIGPDTAICPGGPGVALYDRNPPTPGATYEWSTGQTTPLIAANAVGSYWARISLNGCTTTDSVEVRKDCYLDVPNAFTPNGDGDNDYFLPRELLSRSLNAFHMQVYNRWGQIVFETTSLTGRGWDGKFNGSDQPGGVYIYRIDASFANGVQQNWTGNVTLLR
jgi:gliding motility-associated-like protein